MQKDDSGSRKRKNGKKGDTSEDETELVQLTKNISTWNQLNRRNVTKENKAEEDGKKRNQAKNER